MKPELSSIWLLYGITAAVFFLIDLIWLGVVAKGFYGRHLGNLLRPQVNWWAAVLFYAVYIGGIQVFVLMPALSGGASIIHAALMGGLLGFFAYATFDLTCLALLRKWPVIVAVVDMVWGTVLTASTSAAALWLARSWLKAG